MARGVWHTHLTWRLMERALCLLQAQAGCCWLAAAPQQAQKLGGLIGAGCITCKSSLLSSGRTAMHCLGGETNNL